MTVDLPDYSLARVIKGLHGTDYYTVATDEDGNIVGVFKGEYNEELITIKTDSQGRMLAIITDPEDVYGNIHMIGNAELAARLGSINTFDRRGDTVLMDNFESPTLKWIILPFGTNAGATISTDTAIQGDSCCKLTAGEGVNGLCSMTRYIHPKILGKLGFEFSFTVDDDTKKVQGSIYHFDGTTEYISLVTYDHVNSELQYTDEDLGTVRLATSYTLEDLLDTFHTMKIVIDSVTKKPVRLLVNEDIYDLSAYKAKENAGSGGEKIQLAITHLSDHASVRSIYIDNVILTQNEL